MKTFQALRTIPKSQRNKEGSDHFENVPDPRHNSDKPSPSELIYRLSQALKTEGITYCHWKSNKALDRSASGDNDLDLLVQRADITRFTGILYRLGMKQAKAPAGKQLPGVLDYFGYDKTADKLIHVHAHYQLVLGHDRTKNYRLPIERQYLESAVQRGLFKVPAVEYEFLVFVIRMVIKHATWDVILGGQGRLNKAELEELAYLQARIDQDRLWCILKQHLPYINQELFTGCIRALQPSSSFLMRAKVGYQLQVKLMSNARHSLITDSCLKLWRSATLAIRRRIFKSSAKYRLINGGAMIAILGGDGAGKSTAVDGLDNWLSKDFETARIHMGKPAWSWTTKTIRGILKIGSSIGLYPGASSSREALNQKTLISPSYPQLLRQVCIARDRYRTYVKARRLGAKGGLVILDRFPMPQIQIMDGPQAKRLFNQMMVGSQADTLLRSHRSSPIFGFLSQLEEGYYRQILSPELMIVLRVDPEIAVQRKTDEDAAAVRERSTEIWEINWDHTEAQIIDASKSKSEVLNEIKSLIWSEL
jgi:thymidylate kinase